MGAESLFAQPIPTVVGISDTRTYRGDPTISPSCWEPIFAPDMTIEIPVYILEFGATSGKIIRGTEVRDMYVK
jgi:hypothetical protein